MLGIFSLLSRVLSFTNLLKGSKVGKILTFSSISLLLFTSTYFFGFKLLIWLFKKLWVFIAIGLVLLIAYLVYSKKNQNKNTLGYNEGQVQPPNIVINNGANNDKSNLNW